VRSESIHHSRGTWVQKASCISESKEHHKNGPNITLPNAGVEGNMDAKPLMYQSDPSNPDPEDIVTYSDYLVGYQMKGTQTLAIDKKHEESDYEHGRYLWKQRRSIKFHQEAP
jgi:hypothetical protein